jgi:hypothetical protein
MSEDVEILDVPDAGAEAWYQLAEARGWGDGVPTITPTQEAVEDFLHAAVLAEDDLPLVVPPRRVRPTKQSFAANVLMAGGLPEHSPVVAAALDGVCDERFNLMGVLATTHPCSPLVLVNGPLRLSLRINCAGNCLGQGARANAAIGRSLRLLLQNIGGNTPGVMDMATHGTPAKFSYCFGENEEASPYAPYHVRFGFDPSESVVTVFAGEAPHNINDHGSESGEELLTTIAGTISQVGNNNLLLGGPHVLVVGPEHAETLHGDGWTIPGIQQVLFERSRVSVERVSKANREEIENWGREAVDGYYTIGNSPEDLHVVVAGGHGKHSLWIPTFAGSEAVSRRIEFSPVV